jgi:predicted DNA-binding transcriptional regulator YafY
MESIAYTKNSVQKKQFRYSPNLLNVINNAIDNCKVASVEHSSFGKGITIRDVEPMAIVYKDRRRNLVAWCRLRNEYRSFRLDRIVCIKLKQEQFSRRQDFNVEEFQDGEDAVYTEDIYEDY